MIRIAIWFVVGLAAAFVWLPLLLVSVTVHTTVGVLAAALLIVTVGAAIRRRWRRLALATAAAAVLVLALGWSSDWNPSANPADFDLGRFWASYAVVAGVVAVPIWLFRRRRA